MRRPSVVDLREGGAYSPATVHCKLPLGTLGCQHSTSHRSQATAAVATFFHSWLVFYSLEARPPHLYQLFFCEASLGASLILQSSLRVTTAASAERTGFSRDPGRPLECAAEEGAHYRQLRKTAQDR